MLVVKRDNTKVVITVATDLANSCDGTEVAGILMSFDAGACYTADLLTRYIADRLRRALQDERRKYYNLGHADGRKRSKKMDSFSASFI
jgi:hypothetical protein